MSASLSWETWYRLRCYGKYARADLKDDAWWHVPVWSNPGVNMLVKAVEGGFEKSVSK